MTLFTTFTTENGVKTSIFLCFCVDYDRLNAWMDRTRRTSRREEYLVKQYQVHTRISTEAWGVRRSRSVYFWIDFISYNNICSICSQHLSDQQLIKDSWLNIPEITSRLLDMIISMILVWKFSSTQYTKVIKSPNFLNSSKSVNHVTKIRFLCQGPIEAQKGFSDCHQGVNIGLNIGLPEYVWFEVYSHLLPSHASILWRHQLVQRVAL